MKISGVVTLRAPGGRVWTGLTDPAVLLATIPGCERLEPAGPGSCRFAARAKIASIEGSYTGEVSVSQQHEPSSFVLTVNGAGAPGAVSASVQVRLAETAGGSTELSYDADAVIGGLIAGVGRRVLCSAARRIADDFVSSVDDVLAGSAIAGNAIAGTGMVSPPPAERAAEPPAEPEAALVPATPVPAAIAVPAAVSVAAAAPSIAVPVPAAVSSIAAPVADIQVPAAFARGVLVGAASALAGVALAGLIERRAR